MEVYDALWKDALEAAAAAGGTVAHHHGVGQLKMAAAGRELAGARPLYLVLKAKLDPTGILNPGRLFPEQECPEPSAPPLGIDELSRVATLPAQGEPGLRDQHLAAAGWALRFPTTGRLVETLRGPVEPWESRVLGASLRLPAGRAVFLAVPRSAAGPDPRKGYPLGAYETLTVPIVPLNEPSETVEVASAPKIGGGAPLAGAQDSTADRILRLQSLCLARDIRSTRLTAHGLEFRGPAASAMAALARQIEVDPRKPSENLNEPGVVGAKSGS